MIESRKTLVCMAALAFMTAAVYVALLLIPQKEAYRASMDQISLLSVNPVDVAAAYTRFEGSEHAYVQADGTWYRDGEATDYNETDLRITLISYLYSDNLVAAGAGDLSVYGLEEPVAEAGFETFDGENHSVHFGIATVDQKSRYMMVDDQNSIYTIPVDAFEVIFEESEREDKK